MTPAEEANVSRLISALQFYADPSGYTGGAVMIPDFYGEMDFGSIAEKAIKSYRDEVGPLPDYARLLEAVAPLLAARADENFGKFVLTAVDTAAALRDLLGPTGGEA